MSNRYFGNFSNNTLTLENDDIFHLTKVLRIKKHETIEVVAAETLFLAQVKDYNPFSLEIISHTPLITENSLKTTLIYALPKGDKLDFVLQKSVELGVHNIIIVETERSIAKITKDKEASKLLRYQKIIKNAAMQSKRDFIPQVLGPMALKDALLLPSTLKLMAHEKATLPFAKMLLDLKEEPATLSVLVGPEGGFSESEVKLAEDAGYHIISFGKTILRSETAPLYALSVINNYKEGLK